MFSLNGKADGTSGSIQYIEDIGTNALVRGRFQSQIEYRGFTLQAQAGQELVLDLNAQREQNGMLIDEQVPSQIMIYGPNQSPNELFEQQLQDTGLQQRPVLQHQVAQSGYYLVVTGREQNKQAQFELDVSCRQCQQPPDPQKECVPGRLFIEGAELTTQQWRRCEVVVLEPTRLPDTEKLTIGPDVHVRAHYYITDYHPEGWGEVKLTIDGELEMESKEDHPIVFETHVDGKQWQGLEIKRAGTQLHDFVMKNTINGVHVMAPSVSIRDAEIMLNRHGIRALSGGLVIERVRLHDNHWALDNSTTRNNGSLYYSALDKLTVSDSRFYFNETPIRLLQMSNTVLDKIVVEHNDAGIFIGGKDASQNSPPEKNVVLKDSLVRFNEIGVALQRNGVIDRCIIRDNRQNGVRTTTGFQKVKNSLVERNATDCQHELTTQASCGALHADNNTHTVFRNLIIRDNHHYGVVIQGPGGQQTTGGGIDPAVLNSEITGNKKNAVVFYRGPTASVEFNKIENNGGDAPFFISYFGGDCARSYLGPNRYAYRCQNQPLRIERNNIDIGEQHLVKFFQTANPDEPITLTRNVEMTQNYFGERTVEQLKETIAHDAKRFLLEPLLTDPEPAAGLVIPLDFVEEVENDGETLIDFDHTDASSLVTHGLGHVTDGSSCATPSAYSGRRAFYFGNENTCNYDSGIAFGQLTTSEIEGLTAASTLSFNYLRQVESCVAGGYDKTFIEVIVEDSASEVIWSRDCRDPSPHGWKAAAKISLAAFSGKTIKLRFTFDSVDDYNNDQIGWFIDDILVSR